MSDAASRDEGFIRPRIAPVLFSVLTFFAGLAGRFLVPKGFFSKYSGDVLYTTLIYVLILVVRPREKPFRAFLWATGFSFAIEIFQLTGVPAWLSEKHILLRLIFGTTFAWGDLCAYVVGAALGLGVHCAMRRARASVEATRPEAAERLPPTGPTP